MLQHPYNQQKHQIMKQNEATQNQNKQVETKNTYIVVSQKDTNSIVDSERLNNAKRIEGHIGI